MYLERFQLDGRLAVVTGAARGIGLAISEALAEAGATVVLTDMDGEAAAAAATRITGTGARAEAAALDVTDVAAVEALAADVVARHGRVDILVNNAGIAISNKPAEDMADEVWAKVIDVNLNGVFWCCRAFGRAMLGQGSGSIVNLSSVSAQRGGGIFGGPHYSAAKAGVLGLTKAMARELAPDGIRVNAICPGFIATDITAGKLTPEMHEQILAGIPMGRTGTATDVAGCALFLASDLSSYCTGTEVDVNGGSLIH